MSVGVKYHCWVDGKGGWMWKVGMLHSPEWQDIQALITKILKEHKQVMGAITRCTFPSETEKIIKKKASETGMIGMPAEGEERFKLNLDTLRKLKDEIFTEIIRYGSDRNDPTLFDERPGDDLQQTVNRVGGYKQAWNSTAINEKHTHFLPWGANIDDSIPISNRAFFVCHEKDGNARRKVERGITLGDTMHVLSALETEVKKVGDEDYLNEKDDDAVFAEGFESMTEKVFADEPIFNKDGNGLNGIAPSAFGTKVNATERAYAMEDFYFPPTAPVKWLDVRNPAVKFPNMDLLNRGGA